MSNGFDILRAEPVGRYEIQPDPERARWQVVDRESGECAYSARLPLRGLSQQVAQVWARAMNEGEQFRDKVLKGLSETSERPNV